MNQIQQLEFAKASVYTEREMNAVSVYLQMTKLKKRIREIASDDNKRTGLFRKVMEIVTFESGTRYSCLMAVAWMHDDLEDVVKAMKKEVRKRNSKKEDENED
jgi:hypothetical protein